MTVLFVDKNKKERIRIVCSSLYSIVYPSAPNRNVLVTVNNEDSTLEYFPQSVYYVWQVVE